MCFRQLALPIQKRTEAASLRLALEQRMSPCDHACRPRNSDHSDPLDKDNQCRSQKRHPDRSGILLTPPSYPCLTRTSREPQSPTTGTLHLARGLSGFAVSQATRQHSAALCLRLSLVNPGSASARSNNEI